MFSDDQDVRRCLLVITKASSSSKFKPFGSIGSNTNSGSFSSYESVLDNVFLFFCFNKLNSLPYRCSERGFNTNVGSGGTSDDDTPGVLRGVFMFKGGRQSDVGMDDEEEDDDESRDGKDNSSLIVL